VLTRRGSRIAAGCVAAIAAIGLPALGLAAVKRSHHRKVVHCKRGYVRTHKRCVKRKPAKHDVHKAVESPPAPAPTDSASAPALPLPVSPGQPRPVPVTVTLNVAREPLDEPFCDEGVKVCERHIVAAITITASDSGGQGSPWFTVEAPICAAALLDVCAPGSYLWYGVTLYDWEAEGKHGLVSEPTLPAETATEAACNEGAHPKPCPLPQWERLVEHAVSSVHVHGGLYPTAPADVISEGDAEFAL
jgi:hypothetical protein